MTQDKSAGHFAPNENSAQAQPTPGAQAREGARQPGTPKGGAAAGTPGGAERLFLAASRMGPLFLLVLLAAQVWPTFLGDNFYCPREARSILIFSQTSQSGQWLAPMAGDLAQWPVFAWFLAGLDKLSAALSLASDAHFPLAGAVGSLLALLGVWSLSRIAGFSLQAALAAGLLLLCAPLFAPLAHFTGPETLAAALLLFSLLCLLHGWRKERAWLSLPVGFVLAALAGLAGGLFHVLLPLLTSLAFLIWRGKIRRAQGLDALTGFVLMLLILAGWLSSLILWAHADGYAQSLSTELLLWPWSLPDRWWLPLGVAGAGLLPWIALVFCVSWQRVLRTAWPDYKAGRAENSGVSFIWIALVLGCLLSLVTPNPTGTAACLICLAAPLLGKALLRLSSLGSRLFYLIAALCLLHAGMALAAAGFGPTLDWMARFFSHPLTPEQRELILSLHALPVLGALCLAAAVALTRFTRRDRPGGALMVCALLAVVLAQPAALLLMPELASVPQAQLRRAEDIKAGPLPESGASTPVPAPAPLAPEAAPQTAPVQPGGVDELPGDAANSIPDKPETDTEQSAPAQPDPAPGSPEQENAPARAAPDAADSAPGNGLPGQSGPARSAQGTPDAPARREGLPQAQEPGATPPATGGSEPQPPAEGAGPPASPVPPAKAVPFSSII